MIEQPAECVPAKIQSVAEDIVLAIWELPGTTQRRVLATVDGTAVTPPYNVLQIPTSQGTTRFIMAFRLTERAPSLVSFRDLEGALVAEANAAELEAFNPQDSFSDTDPVSQARVLKLLAEFCRVSFNLHNSASLAAICRQIVNLLAPQLQPLRAQVALTPNSVLHTGTLTRDLGDISAAILLGPTWLRLNPVKPETQPLQGLRSAIRLTAPIEVAQADPVVILLGQNGIACRRLTGARGVPSLLKWLDSNGKTAKGSIETIGRSLGQMADSDPSAADAAREIQILMPAAPRSLTSGERPLCAEIETAFGHDTGGLFVTGWIRDPFGMVQSLRAVSAIGEASSIDLKRTARILRSDIEQRYQNSPYRASNPRHGFAHFTRRPESSIPALQHRFELVLKSGASIDLVAPAQPHSPSEARNRILGSIPTQHLTAEILAETLAPPAARLHKAHLAQKRPPETRNFGEPPSDPELSMIIPLYRNLEFLKFQVAALASDHDIARAEVIYVLDSPEQAEEVEHLLAGLHGVFGLPLRLIIQSDNFGYSSANNAGFESSRAPVCAFVNSDIIPDRPGWMRPMLRALSAPGVGAAGPKLLFDDGSLQHAGLFFGKSSKGRWYNQHYYKGYPRDFAPAQFGRPVPGVTGACLWIKSDLYRRVGGFTEDYIIGDYEDSDLCLKVQDAGFQIVYVPEAELYHLERQSISRHSGYMRGVASEYNGWLHDCRWNNLMGSLMDRMNRMDRVGTSEAGRPMRRNDNDRLKETLELTKPRSGESAA